MKEVKKLRSQELRQISQLRYSLISLVTVSCLLFFLSCARQGYPTGGPKDEQPPMALGSKPANESRHFAEKEFYIQFDEYVVLKNATENVLVSPPMKQKPEFTTKGKGVLVKIKDTLQENTTYLFQFKEAIADFTEGNLLPSYEYVFSTGEKMDTLMLTGRVLDARSGKPWKETVTVMAYRVTHSSALTAEVHWTSCSSPNLGEELDTMATTVQPDFVTRCDKEGRFAFHYIPAGSYRLVALEDKNRNLRVDVSDAVAWDTVAVASHPLSDSTHHLHYFISQPENRQQRITKSEFTKLGQIVVTTQIPMQQPTLEGVEGEWRLNSRRDTLTLWCLDAKCDSAQLVVSDPTGLQDTLKLRYTKKSKGGRRKIGSKEEKTPLIKALCDGSKAYYDDLRLAFANPIVKQADSAQAEMMFLKDSTLHFYPIVVDSTGLGAHIMASLKSDEQYRVRIAENLFTDLYGNTTDSLTFTLTPKDYGILSINIDNRMGYPLVVEVLDSRDTIVQHSTLNTQHSTLKFFHLPAGDYRLRAVVDRNGDGRWTPGDYRLQRQPEQTLMFEKTLSLREKWEMEEKWVVKEETMRVEFFDKKALMPLKEVSPGGLGKPNLGR